jgi:hypothetical protein
MSGTCLVGDYGLLKIADLSQRTPADNGLYRRNPMTSRPGAEGRSLARAPEAARQHSIRPAPAKNPSR